MVAKSGIGWEIQIIVRSLCICATFAISSLSSAQDKLSEMAESLRPRYVVGSNAMPRYSLEERMAHYGVPGVAVGVIKNGRLIHAAGFGVLQQGGNQPVDGDTLFSVGSVSKVATAAMVMRLQDEGLLDVNASVPTYLKSWHMPANEFASADDISLRMILSHTAGLNVHGFPDFMPGDPLPSVIDTLNGERAAKTDPLAFLFKPGTRYKYSGGGYTLAQLIVTDALNGDFPALARDHLFKPLGMARSTFANPLPTDVVNVAKAHNREGKPVALPRGYEAFPEMAASGLWTSANDLGSLVAEMIRSYQGENGFLSQKTATDMMTEVARSNHGLGPRLVGSGNMRIFHHGGANDSYRAWMEGHLETGDGLVVLTNGTRGGNLYVEIRNAVADTFDWAVNQPTEVPKVTVPEDQLADYQGQFKPDNTFPTEHRRQMIGWIFDYPLTVSLSGGKLHLSWEGTSRKGELIPIAPNRFIIAGLNQRIGLAELVFHRDGHGKTVSMTLELENARSFYGRVTPDAAR